MKSAVVSCPGIWGPSCWSLEPGCCSVAWKLRAAPLNSLFCTANNFAHTWFSSCLQYPFLLEKKPLSTWNTFSSGSFWSWTSSIAIVWDSIRNINSQVRPRPPESTALPFVFLHARKWLQGTLKGENHWSITRLFYCHKSWLIHTPAQLCVAFFITQKSKVLCLCRKFGKIQKNGPKGGKWPRIPLLELIVLTSLFLTFGHLLCTHLCVQLYKWSVLHLFFYSYIVT